jgi:hypothetical protein
MATAIAQNNDRLWVKGLCYGTATLVGYARIEQDADWLSDTVASAFIGIGFAKSVSNANHERRGLVLVPTASPDGWDLTLSKRF